MTPGRPSAAGGGESSRDWATVLDELEGEVLAAESVLRSDREDQVAAWGRRAEDWVPPSAVGPVPEVLRERAARLLQHQLAVAEELVERIIQSRRQRDVAARMSYGPPRPVASYIDRAL